MKRTRSRTLSRFEAVGLVLAAILVAGFLGVRWIGQQIGLVDDRPYVALVAEVTVPKSPKYVRLIDGDTIMFDDMKVRLHGIDAVEKDQTCISQYGRNYRCGVVAITALSTLTTGKTIRCDDRGQRDRYNRVIAVCWVGDVEINRWMVAQGHAVALVKYSHDYVDAEREAREAKRGIWAGAFDMPWDYRASWTKQ